MTKGAGGRYDSLIEQLGGKANHAVGFAMGMERLLSLVENVVNLECVSPVDVYLIRVGTEAEKAGIKLAEQIRNELPSLKLQMHCGGGSFKSQFKKADKCGAEYAIILGDDEISKGEISIKPLRTDGAQINLPQNEAVSFLTQIQ